MARRRTAQDMEREAAAAEPVRSRRSPPPGGEVMAMLARRGLRPRPTRLDLPFPPDLPVETAERLLERLGHYAFRLFLRGAIQKPAGFAPGDATRYLEPAQSAAYAEDLVALGLATRLGRGRYRLVHPVTSFGDTLEWYVASELRLLGFDVATGVKYHAPGVGGDLDVVAAAEGKLCYLELKSSPPKHLSVSEVTGFVDRMQVVGPDVTLFVMDTALRLSDKVLPMLIAELDARRSQGRVVARRVQREVWALTPHLYALNGRPDLIANIGRSIAEGLRALAPPL